MGNLHLKIEANTPRQHPLEFHERFGGLGYRMVDRRQCQIQSIHLGFGEIEFRNSHVFFGDPVSGLPRFITMGMILANPDPQIAHDGPLVGGEQLSLCILGSGIWRHASGHLGHDLLSGHRSACSMEKGEKVQDPFQRVDPLAMCLVHAIVCPRKQPCIDTTLVLALTRYFSEHVIGIQPGRRRETRSRRIVPFSLACHGDGDRYRPPRPDVSHHRRTNAPDTNGCHGRYEYAQRHTRFALSRRTRTPSHI